jgi:hypothetical protein
MLDQGLKHTPKLIKHINWFAEFFNNNNFNKLLGSLSKNKLCRYTIKKVLYC